MRPTKTLITALAATATALAAAGPAFAEPTTLATQERPFGSVDAARGVAVWSAYDPKLDAYRLVALKDGERRTLSVAPSQFPFDADVGTSRTGALVAVYSRVRGEEDADLYRYSFAADRETLLADLSTEGTDERDPSVWRGDIAFVRATASKQHLMVGNTTSTGAPRTLVSRRASTGSILDPALSAGRVAYLATTRENAYGFPSQAVNVLTRRTKRVRTLHTARSGGANFAAVTGPSWSDSGKALYFARTNQGSGTGNRYWRWSPRTGRSQARGDRRATATAWMGGPRGLLVTTNPAQDGTCSYDGSPRACVLLATGPLTFTP